MLQRFIYLFVCHINKRHNSPQGSTVCRWHCLEFWSNHLPPILLVINMVPLTLNVHLGPFVIYVSTSTHISWCIGTKCLLTHYKTTIGCCMRKPTLNSVSMRTSVGINEEYHRAGFNHNFFREVCKRRTWFVLKNWMAKAGIEPMETGTLTLDSFNQERGDILEKDQILQSPPREKFL